MSETKKYKVARTFRLPTPMLEEGSVIELDPAVAEDFVRAGNLNPIEDAQPVPPTPPAPPASDEGTGASGDQGNAPENNDPPAPPASDEGAGASAAEGQGNAGTE